MLRCHHVLLGILICTAPAFAGEIFSVITPDGPVSGTVKKATATEVVIQEAARERVILLADLMPRDVYRCRKQALKPDDAQGLFELGQYCAQNSLRREAFKVWDLAMKANPQEFRNKIAPLWNAMLKNERDDDTDSAKPPEPPKKPASTPAGGAPAPQKSRRLRVLEAGKTYSFPDVAWEKRQKLDTPHYHIETNVPELSGKYLMVLMEELYKFYGQRLNSAPREKLTVYVFANRGDFEAEAAKAGHPVTPSIGGFYVNHPSATHCAIYIPWIMQGGADPTSVLMHEGFHQFYHRTFNKSDPVWLNEGMAVYFESSVFDGDKITDACISPTRLEYLQKMIREGTNDSLEKLLGLSQKEYQFPQYGEGWAFVYYLAWGNPDNKARQADIRSRFVAFLTAMRSKKGDLETFEKTTGLKVKSLEDDWKKWILSLDPEDPFGGKGDPRK